MFQHSAQGVKSSNLLLSVGVRDFTQCPGQFVDWTSAQYSIVADSGFHCLSVVSI